MARRNSRLSWSFSAARYSSCICCKSSASASRSAARACPVCWASPGDLARIWRTIWRIRSERALVSMSSARCASCSESAGFCSAVESLNSWSCSASRSVSRCKLPSCSCWRRPLWPSASSRLIWLWRRASSAACSTMARSCCSVRTCSSKAMVRSSRCWKACWSSLKRLRASARIRGSGSVAAFCRSARACCISGVAMSPMSSRMWLSLSSSSSLPVPSSCMESMVFSNSAASSSTARARSASAASVDSSSFFCSQLSSSLLSSSRRTRSMYS